MQLMDNLEMEIVRKSMRKTGSFLKKERDEEIISKLSTNIDYNLQVVKTKDKGLGNLITFYMIY